MDTYVSSETERRKQGVVFGTADELRILRTLNARANAMRRMAGNKAARKTTGVAAKATKTGTRVA